MAAAEVVAVVRRATQNAFHDAVSMFFKQEDACGIMRP